MGSQKTDFPKKMEDIIAIVLIRGATCLKHKFLSEVCFGMIFLYFTIDIIDIYGHEGM